MYQLAKMILTIAIGFETMNKRSLSFFDARTASKFFFKINNLDLHKGAKLFINEGLCPFYKGLWVICKKLGNRKRTRFGFIANGISKFRLEKNSPVTHRQDLKNLFPDVYIDAL